MKRTIAAVSSVLAFALTGIGSSAFAAPVPGVGPFASAAQDQYPCDPTTTTCPSGTGTGTGTGTSTGTGTGTGTSTGTGGIATGGVAAGPCVANGQVTLQLPATGAKAKSIKIYVSVLASMLGGTTTPAASNAFVTDAAAKFLHDVKLAPTQPDSLQPSVVSKLAQTITSVQTPVTTDLSQDLSKLGFPLNAQGLALVPAGQSVRIDVVETLSDGSTVRHHTLVLPCATPPPGGINVNLARFTTAGAPGSGGGGISAGTLVIVLILGAGAFGVATGVVRRRLAPKTR